MKVHIVKGVDAHDTVILKVFCDFADAVEWMDNYDGEEDFAYLAVDTRDVE